MYNSKIVMVEIVFLGNFLEKRSLVSFFYVLNYLRVIFDFVDERLIL